jgi:hypothetical protein
MVGLSDIGPRGVKLAKEILVLLLFIDQSA